MGKVLAKELKNGYEVVCFLDNDKRKWGTIVDDIKVLGGAETLKSIDFDEIVIASTMRFEEIKKQILNIGISSEVFNESIHRKLMVEVDSRVNFLRDFAYEHKHDSVEYSVAEGGVFQGMFAAEINKNFPERKLFLFDTFDGFDTRDVTVETDSGFSNSEVKRYSDTSIDLVMGKMLHPDKVVIKKGYFPETVAGLENEKFIFVNLDFDLYLPILAGLQFFYTRLAPGGVILVHDYFTKIYHGVKEAVDEFEKQIKAKVIRMPIGDGISIAILSNK